MGDTAFDSIEIYIYLLQGASFEKAFIPLKNKLKIIGINYSVNEKGIPYCPKDSSLLMCCEGSKTHLHCGLPTMKFVCPKMKWVYNKETKRRICHCDNPCTTTSCGRMIYIYPEQNLHACPGTARGTLEWDNTYKTRANIEKTINHFKITKIKKVSRIQLKPYFLKYRQAKFKCQQKCRNYHSIICT